MKTSPPILFFKSHVETYTRKDGTVVRAHDDTRTQAQKDDDKSNAKFMAHVGRSMGKQDADREQKEKQTAKNNSDGDARELACADAVKNSGLAGDRAHYFKQGFLGWPIKSVNPRKDGCEKEFRDGAAAGDAWYKVHSSRRQ